MSLDNQKFIYNELDKNHQIQQDGIDYINNKFNWILVADTVLLGLVIDNGVTADLELIALLFLVLSIVISVVSLFTRNYRRGPKLKKVMDKVNDKPEDLLDYVNEKMHSAIQENRKPISMLATYLKAAILSLLVGVILLFISILNLNHITEKRMQTTASDIRSAIIFMDGDDEHETHEFEEKINASNDDDDDFEKHTKGEPAPEKK